MVRWRGIFVLLIIFWAQAFWLRPAWAQVDFPVLRARLQQGSIIVDHTQVYLYDQIPQYYKDRAADTPMVFSDRSVGVNINEYLDCLQTPSAQAVYPCKVNHLDSNFTVDPALLQWTSTADRSNWSFELRAGDWHGLTADFFATIIPTYLISKEVLSYQFSYLNITDNTIVAPNNPDCNTTQNVHSCGGFLVQRPEVLSRYDVSDLLAFENTHPNKVIIYWTSSLARGIGTTYGRDFNNAMRAFAQTNKKVLFDMADIIQYTPDGQPCFDNRDGVEYCNPNKCENYADDGEDLPAICQHYTTETDGGHLGSASAGGLLTARGLWVLMAQLAGWNPTGSTTPPPATSTPVPPTLTPTPLPGDYDEDRDRDMVDLRQLLGSFGGVSQVLNLLGTSVIDIFDFNFMVRFL
ncbi:hypothetical protein A2W24_04100 [Microgenomates group bacterium RBG_16_45_19]|nr:MAG: hypothetical protein A2W24_04100 [Microgenomates group bacterium RBG_16_45_19]